MKKLLIAILLFPFAVSCFAADAFVSGNKTYYFHSGPSTKYKIKGSVSIDEAVNIIDTKSSNRFYKIRTTSNKTGWINKKYVTTGQSDQTIIKTLRQDLTDSVSLIKKQADEIHRLKMLVNVQKVNNDQQTDQKNKLASKINELNNQLSKLDDSNLIRWVTHISTIILLTLLLIYFLSMTRKRKKYI